MLYFIGNEFLTRTKGIILITLLLLSTCLEAKNYYISADGNNSNDGLSPTTAWQTITKVNSFVYNRVSRQNPVMCIPALSNNIELYGVLEELEKTMDGILVIFNK